LLPGQALSAYAMRCCCLPGCCPSVPTPYHTMPRTPCTRYGWGRSPGHPRCADRRLARLHPTSEHRHRQVLQVLISAGQRDCTWQRQTHFHKCIRLQLFIGDMGYSGCSRQSCKLPSPMWDRQSPPRAHTRIRLSHRLPLY
jgi:hypothetical protein